MRNPSRAGWSWRFVAGLALIAGLAQACGGSSSQSTGSQTGRAEFRFSQVKGTRLGALPQGCTKVDVNFQPGNQTFTLNDTQGSILLPAGTYTASAQIFCPGGPVASDPPNPVVIVPASLNQVQLSFVFGGVNVQLTVRVNGAGLSVSGEGISCPGDCTQTFFAGTSVKLTANNPEAVFTGGCSGTGSCTILMNQDKTVFVSLSVTQDGFIQVSLIGCCDADILVDGALVANDLTSDDPPVTTQVSPGTHQVRALCFSEGDASGSPATVNVGPGQTVVQNFSCD
jgi:hypothetical protein